jgi:hypothetical protein
MSPEMDLLDHLCGGDENLFVALQVFGWPDDAQAFARGHYAISKQIEEGIIQIKQRRASNERVLPEWEAKQALSNEENWLKQGEEKEFYLSLTEKGASYIVGR